MAHTIYVDGSPKGRVAIVIPGNDPVIKSSVIGIDSNVTNNEAEYLAALESLKFIDAYVHSTVDTTPWRICSDSKLVVMQSNNIWKCRAENLRPYLNQIWYYLDNLPVTVRFKWVPRDNNPAGTLLEDILSFERQVDREINDEAETGKVREYAKKLLREL